MTGKRSTTTRRLSQAETIRLGAVLQAALVVIPTPEGADPLVEFKDGWNDERCALEVAPDLNEGHARGLRSSVFGKLYVRGPAKDNAADPRVEALAEQLALTRKELWDLVDKYDKLCLALAVNRVVDARHLAVRQPGHHPPK